MDRRGSNPGDAMVSIVKRGTEGLPRRAVDAALIPRSLSGDEAASRALFAYYYPVASAFLRKLGVQGSDVEDVCQEVFMQFFRYLGSFRGEAELQTWLFRVCVTQARRARRRRKVSDLVAAILMREIRAGAVSPAQNSDGTMVERALACMGPDLREAFVLFELEGLSGKEVADILRCPAATVWRRLHDARRIFRETVDSRPFGAAGKGQRT
jgi:RNA polymerase sigma-70 factor, ECF subfamily